MRKVRLKSVVIIPQKRQARSTGHCVAFARDAKKSRMLNPTSAVSPLNINRRLEYGVFIRCPVLRTITVSMHGCTSGVYRLKAGRALAKYLTGDVPAYGHKACTH